MWRRGMPELRVGYYVHHHGAGHATRAVCIARAMQVPVTLIGSQLPEFLPPGIDSLRLPGDTAPGMQVESFDTLHYAPLNVRGLCERMALLAQWFSDNWPCLLVVDVSVEVALLARLCSVPVVYMRQHGQRDDAAHSLAYECATALLAPYPAQMEARDTPLWLREKTLYSGWLSRFAGTPPAAPQHGQVLVITGHGGSGLSAALLEAVARYCPAWQFRVVGSLTAGPPAANLHWLGQVADPSEAMRSAEIVIGSASDSLVGEAASLGCRFIAVAEDRPFAEQRQQARRLNELEVATGLAHGWPAVEQWPALLDAARGLAPERWAGWADAGAPARAAQMIEETLQRVLKTRGAPG